MSKQENTENKKFSIWDLPDVPMGQLPPHLQLQRTRVVCKADAPVHVCLTYFLILFLDSLGLFIQQGFIYSKFLKSQMSEHFLDI